jgi:acetyl esterase
MYFECISIFDDSDFIDYYCPEFGKHHFFNIMNFKLLSIIAWLFSMPLCFGQSLYGFNSHIYKSIDTTELKLFVRHPEKQTSNHPFPAIVFFFGGGWNSGSITQFRPHAEYFTARGMVAILVEYRVKNLHNSTPFDAVADAKSAIRFIRENATELHIDPSRIVASGGSAGGHLAAATATIHGLDELTENLLVSSRPNALILFNPVFDNGPTGYGYERVGERYPEISPLHNIRTGIPPTIVFLGTLDTLIPVETAKLYKQKMEDYRNRCDLFIYEGQSHGFFNFGRAPDNNYYIETIKEADHFLASLGFIK